MVPRNIVLEAEMVAFSDILQSIDGEYKHYASMTLLRASRQSFGEYEVLSQPPLWDLVTSVRSEK